MEMINHNVEMGMPSLETTIFGDANPQSFENNIYLKNGGADLFSQPSGQKIFLSDESGKWFIKPERGANYFLERYDNSLGELQPRWLGSDTGAETQRLFYLPKSDSWIMQQRYPYENKPDTFSTIPPAAAANWLKKNGYRSEQVRGKANEFFNDTVNQIQ